MSIRRYPARWILCAVMVVSTGGPARALAQRTIASADQPASRAAELLLSRPVTLDLTDVSRKTVVDLAAKRANVVVQYRTNIWTKYGDLISVHLRNAPLRDALAQALEGTGLTVIPDGETRLVIVESATTQAQPGLTGSITGRVTDSASGRGLGNANVRVQGTSLSVITTDSGSFILRKVPAGTALVSVRLFGYRPVTQSVTVKEDAQATARLRMVSVPTMLSEIVTTATGARRRVDIGNDITTINADSVMRVAPISSVTDLLEGRVPGLTVLRSSGAPGDPSRLRLRGASSITGNNDPIVIVDGMRVYASQSDARNASLAPSAFGGTSTAPTAAPSPIDQIDPNTIASIDVFKGPSATSLYGSDAGNGVIVITTKRGRAGPTRWTLSADQGVNWMPGPWPINYYRFGTNSYNLVSGMPANGSPLGTCPWYDTGCTVDSIVPFQALNDPRYTVFAHGSQQDLALSASGGAQNLLYSLTGSAQATGGYIKLPGLEQQRYNKFYGPISSHLVRPDKYTALGGSGQISAQLNPDLTVVVQSSLRRGLQQRSSLESAIAQLQGTYIDPTELASGSLLQGEYQRATDRQLTTSNNATLDWGARPWLRLNAAGGVQTIQRTDETFVPFGVNRLAPGVAGADTSGFYGLGRGTSQVTTLTLGTTIPLWAVRLAIGVNYVNQTTADISASTNQLAPGVTQPSDFPTTVLNGTSPSAFSQASTAVSTYGWYVQPTLQFKSRLTISPGFRLDGGSASGSRAGLSGFPKVDVSYLAVEPEHPVGILSQFRPRIAYGYAGTQPSPADRLRTLHGDQSGSINGGATQVPLLGLATLGNTELRPERSSEAEGGFDASFGNERLQLTYTVYDKTRHDAIISISLPPSVCGGGGSGIACTINRNIGVVRDRGTEATMDMRLLDASAISWNASASMSHNVNKVIRLNPGQPTIFRGSARIEPGYPLWSDWERPIVSYADGNGDGVIQPNEVRLGDSAVYIGETSPKYQLDFSSAVALWNGRLRVTAGATYQNGMTQIQGGGGAGYSLIGLMPNAPGATMATQAAVVVAGVTGSPMQSAIGLIQVVDVFRFNSLSINYLVPVSIARRFRAASMSIALQGSNLGIHTNYRGLDPNVNVYSTATKGDFTQDTGQLPQPRTWLIKLQLGN